jgi:hypothetical protein
MPTPQKMVEMTVIPEEMVLEVVVAAAIRAAVVLAWKGGRRPWSSSRVVVKREVYGFLYGMALTTWQLRQKVGANKQTT